MCNYWVENWTARRFFWLPFPFFHIKVCGGYASSSWGKISGRWLLVAVQYVVFGSFWSNSRVFLQFYFEEMLPGNFKKHSIQKSLILESNFLALLQVGLSTMSAEVQEVNYFPVRKFSIEKETFLSYTHTNPCNLVIKKLVQVGKAVE